MNTLIICFSYHHGNTSKVASVIAKTLDAEAKAPSDVDPNVVCAYDLVGFGSGISFGKHYKEILNFAAKLPNVADKKAFIFSTSGSGGKTEQFHQLLRETLVNKGFDIAGEFNCAGFDTYGVLKLAGGIKKGHPNEKDLKDAGVFAQSLKQPATA
jgi:flavodoxin